MPLFEPPTPSGGGCRDHLWALAAIFTAAVLIAAAIHTTNILTGADL